MANYTTTITNEGAALLASVIANQGTLTFNEFRFSENDYTGQEPTLTEVTFLGVFITASAAASVIDSTTIKTSAQFNNSTITGNHDLYSIGIIGTDGNTTALIAVCTTTDPDVIREPLTGTSTYAFNVNLSVSDTSQITVVGTTAAVIYDIDVVDNLTSPATNKPLSANQGRLVADNLAANENVYGAKNIWNIEKWLNDIGQAFTKSGDVYTTTISDARTNTNKCVFSDTDIEVTLSAELTASGSMQFYVELFDSNDNNVGSISLSNPTFTGIGCKVRFNFNNTGTVTLTAPMLRDARILDDTFTPYAETNLQLTRKTSGLSNENLLNNPWFTVNQRGATTITSGYGADRWKMVDGSSATFSSSGVTMIAQLNNYFENQLPNGVYTASIKYADGTIESGTLTKSNDTDTIRFIQRAGLTLGYAAASKFFYIYTDVSTSIRAVKLEVGAKSTLANDVAPDYTTELLKCQRYFQRISALAGYAILATGVMDDATTLWGQIPLTVPLRATPTVSTAGTFNIRHGGALQNISSITLDLRSPTMLSFFVTPSTNLTAGTPAQLLFNTTSTYIDLSADL